MIIEKLKKETRSLHDEVEAAMGSEELMRDDFSKERYKLLLQNLWQAHSALEPAVLQHERIARHPELEVERRLHKRKLLAEDLAELSAEPGEPMPVIDLPTLPQAWGAMYVLEGSSLGGAMIYKHLKKLNWDVQAFRFYNCYGKDTGKLWSRFKTILQQENEPAEENLEELLQGANTAYGTFIKAAEQQVNS